MKIAANFDTLLVRTNSYKIIIAKDPFPIYEVTEGRDWFQ